MTAANDRNKTPVRPPFASVMSPDGPTARFTPVAVAVLLLVVVACLAGVWGGPALGDHEAIVARCARDMRLSSDWLVPRFLNTPFIRKPPLSYWLVAAGSYLFGNDAATGLPVTDAAARFPSALTALGTILLLWRLASSMFGRRIGLVAAVVSAANVFVLLYAVNATAEMALTFCCTWAWFHFWFAVTHPRTSRRRLHLLAFYIALGVGMLAKGPAPLAMVAVPLAVWWYLHRPLRILAQRRPACIKRSALCLLRQIPARTIMAFTRLWIVPGVLVFLAIFVPWMIAVAQRHPYAWDLWNWQYLQRFEGDYEDTRVRGMFYYVPIVLGLVLPWTLSLIEGLAAPWLRGYRRIRRQLFYVGLWGVLGVVVMSAMEFKKPYYVAPAIPGLLLLAAVAVDRFFSQPARSRKLLWIGCAALIIGLIAGAIGGHLWLRDNLPTETGRLTLMAGVGVALLSTAGVLHVLGRRTAAFATAAATIVVVFHVAWNVTGPTIDNVDKVAALARELDAAGVPDDAAVYWADQRPDARLGFYFNRRSAHLIEVSEIVTRMVDRTGADATLEQMVLDRVRELLDGPRPVYLILDRRHLDRHADLLGERSHLLATVDLDGKPDAADWVVITNTPPANPPVTHPQ